MVRATVEISEADYGSVRDFIVEKTGLNYPESKREELVTILQDRLAVHPRCKDLGAYLSLLRSGEDLGREFQGLVSRLAVGETYFFRNRAQFAVLRDEILPGIIARKRRKDRRLRIWSAGCSTGEEPYSLAILVHELLGDRASWDVRILATDLNEDALAAARAGFYRPWSFRDVEEAYRTAYFQRQEDGWRIRPEIREMVTFRALNLADDLYPTSVTETDDLDLVLCRNVMIYFRPELCLEITRRFFLALEPEGFLLVGHSEHSDLIFPGFSRRFFGRGLAYVKSGPNPAWEKGIAMRFRGAGPVPPGAVTHDAGLQRREGGPQRPPGTPETVFFERAVALVAEKRPAEAIAEFKRVVEVNPANERALYSIAMLLADTGDDAGAEEWVARLLKVNSLHLEANYLEAILARETGRRDRELAALKKTLYLNPAFVLGHFQMGAYYLRGGNERLARRFLLNVLDLIRDKAPGDPVLGVEGMTVGRLRETVTGMVPGGVPGGGGA